MNAQENLESGRVLTIYEYLENGRALLEHLSTGLREMGNDEGTREALQTLAGAIERATLDIATAQLLMNEEASA